MWSLLDRVCNLSEGHRGLGNDKLFSLAEISDVSKGFLKYGVTNI